MRFVFSELCEDNSVMKVEYEVLSGQRYGISGRYCCDDESGEIRTPGLFITEAEALEWCRWLTQNKVLPSSLNYVLSDEFYIHIIPQAL